MDKNKSSADDMGSGNARKTSPSTKKKKQTERLRLEKLKSSFNKAKEKIKNTIVTTKPPGGDFDITDCYSLSLSTLSGYVTLDWKHCVDIIDLISNIGDYAEDQTRIRPMNVLMQAESGSGKSHFIKCLAQTMSAHNIQEVSFNMTAVECMEDLATPLDAVRNVKVNDRLPLLFLDEFDCTPKNFPILLPLLWDGELQIGHRALKVGKIVIVLAGSGKEVLEAMELAKTMREEITKEKGRIVDLLSRINGGVLTIPGLNDVTEDRDRRIDKVCLVISLLTQRFGNTLEQVPWSLLSFVSQSKFRYSVRSIAHLINLIPASALKSTTLKTEDLDLPLANKAELENSSLAYHLIVEGENDIETVTNLWKQLKAQDVSITFKRATSKFQLEGVQRLLLQARRHGDLFKST